MQRPEVRFDPSLVEETVFLVTRQRAASGDGHALAAFHMEREAVYAVEDAAQQDAAFQRVAHRSFHQLELDKLFTDTLEEFLRLAEHVELVLVRRVWLKQDEQVALYRSRPPEASADLVAATTLFIGLQADRCLERDALVTWLRQELTQIADKWLTSDTTLRATAPNL